jgi:hypothetical protein
VDGRYLVGAVVRSDREIRPMRKPELQNSTPPIHSPIWSIGPSGYLPFPRFRTPGCAHRCVGATNARTPAEIQEDHPGSGRGGGRCNQGISGGATKGKRMWKPRLQSSSSLELTTIDPSNIGKIEPVLKSFGCEPNSRVIVAAGPSSVVHADR